MKTNEFSFIKQQELRSFILLVLRVYPSMPVVGHWLILIVIGIVKGLKVSLLPPYPQSYVLFILLAGTDLQP
jgi:hypothetical protein